VEAVQAAKGAEYIGFIFFPSSPRNITPKDAEALRQHIDAESIAVTVDPSDELLKNILGTFKADYIQLHGDETPERIRHIKKTFFLPVIKALKISTKADIEMAAAYENVADMLMFDAKSPGELPGGNGVAFDWHMLAGRKFKRPYFLSGGLSINNIEKALRESGAAMVDISSGLESSPGNKDPEMIDAFIQKCKSL
jgi:phosphoribosylanthranilate isomerase